MCHAKCGVMNTVKSGWIHRTMTRMSCRLCVFVAVLVNGAAQTRQARFSHVANVLTMFENLHTKQNRRDGKSPTLMFHFSNMLCKKSSAEGLMTHSH